MAGHLNDKKNAKGNSLLKRLVATNFVCHECSYRVIGIGPLFDQQPSMDLHKRRRDQMAALERAVADQLTNEVISCWGRLFSLCTSLPARKGIDLLLTQRQGGATRAASIPIPQGCR
jgi:hypothetical protein